MIVLGIGAHPDDLVLSCGGTLLRHAMDQDQVFALMLSAGEKVRHADPACRIGEAQAGLRILGVLEDRVMIRPFQDTRFQESIAEIGDALREIFAEISPEMLYIPSLSDLHQDHQALRIAVEAVTRISPRPAKILAYEAGSAQSDFRPQQYTILSDWMMHQKLRALAEHKSENGKKYASSEYITTRAHWRAAQIGLPSSYAEAFEIVRSIDLPKNPGGIRS